MARYQGESYADRTVTVDNNHYDDCDFRNVEFLYLGGPLPGFVNCRLTDVRLSFAGPAANTAQLISLWMASPLSAYVESALRAAKARGAPGSAAVAEAPRLGA